MAVARQTCMTSLPSSTNTIPTETVSLDQCEVAAPDTHTPTAPTLTPTMRAEYPHGVGGATVVPTSNLVCTASAVCGNRCEALPIPNATCTLEVGREAQRVAAPTALMPAMLKFSVAQGGLPASVADPRASTMVTARQPCRPHNIKLKRTELHGTLNSPTPFSPTITMPRRRPRCLAGPDA